MLKTIGIFIATFFALTFLIEGIKYLWTGTFEIDWFSSTGSITGGFIGLYIAKATGLLNRNRR
ncbi:hypothetical protein DEDE109153_13600 [Deinococcus deserti]|uniref:Uncharacterized protein n=1 Tax=Deinococcus deserti (strain DSM 17065 / CIP 109153 / LMG 22923 / VCD115) TaxID=546414 RepID=X5HLA7_DEIDV|nr:hypothetical protein [Deinococcus deserti]AHX26481.1 hypothetical protein Deide_01892 [Deinococcus deserti VCD115]